MVERDGVAELQCVHAGCPSRANSDVSAAAALTYDTKGRQKRLGIMRVRARGWCWGAGGKEAEPRPGGEAYCRSGLLSAIRYVMVSSTAILSSAVWARQDLLFRSTWQMLHQAR